MVEVLEEFPSVRIDAGVLVAALPLLQPRYYSVSSSPALHRGQVHLTLSGVEFCTQGKVFTYLAFNLFVIVYYTKSEVPV